MSVTLLLVMVVISSFIIGRLVARFASRYVVLSGAEYMLVGVLIGPHAGLGLLHESTLDFVRPLISLLLGLTGFVVGLRGRDAIQSPRLAMLGFGSALGVVALTGACLLPLLVRLVPSDARHLVLQRELVRGDGWVFEIYLTSDHLWLALCIGAAAAVTSSVLIEGLIRVHGAVGPVTDVLRASARASQLTAVIVLGLVLATTRAAESGGGSMSLLVWQWEVAAVAGSVVLGLLFGLFIGRDSDPSRIFLASVGLVTFAAGAGAVLAVSPLFVNLLAGLTVATTSAHAGPLRRELDRLQHVLFVLTMVFAGALWSPVHGLVWIMPFAYVVVRVLSRRLVTGFFSRLLLSEPVPRIGQAFLGQGTLATAVAVDFAMRFPQWESLVLTTVLLGTLLSELFSQRVTRRVLSDAGELGSDVNLAPEPKTSSSQAMPALHAAGEGDAPS